MTIGFASMKVSSNLAESSFRRMWGREARLGWVKEIKKCEQVVNEKFEKRDEKEEKRVMRNPLTTPNKRCSRAYLTAGRDDPTERYKWVI